MCRACEFMCRACEFMCRACEFEFFQIMEVLQQLRYL